ncbi:MAG: hypothetical protein WAM97_03320 [Acidimicrobiales bacterium]
MAPVGAWLHVGVDGEPFSVQHNWLAGSNVWVTPLDKAVGLSAAS